MIARAVWELSVEGVRDRFSVRMGSPVGVSARQCSNWFAGARNGQANGVCVAVRGPWRGVSATKWRLVPAAAQGSARAETSAAVASHWDHWLLPKGKRLGNTSQDAPLGATTWKELKSECAIGMPGVSRPC